MEWHFKDDESAVSQPDERIDLRGAAGARNKR